MKPKHLLPSRIAMIAGSVAAPAILHRERFRRKDAAADLVEIRAAIKSQKTSVEDGFTQVKTLLATADEQIKTQGEMNATLKADLTSATEKAAEAIEKSESLEQELVKIRESLSQRKQAQKSLGTRFAESDEVKAFLERKSKSASMEFKAITEATTGTGDAGDLIVPQRVPGIIAQPDRPMVIRDLLSNSSTVSNSIDFVQETGFTNAAAMVAEGALKPESDIKFELQSAPVRTLAHWIMASIQVLDDVPQLMGYIDQRLRYGLMLEEEEQLLSGDGTGQNLLGIIPQATAFDTGRAQVGDTAIDIIRRAMTQVRIAEYRPDAIVIHPDSWEDIELTKTTDGAYVWANPAMAKTPALWSLPVVTTTALASGEFLVGNFQMAATVWDRMQARVDVAREDGDNFKKNMVTIRGEERLALTVFRPESLIYGDLSSIVSA